jgi:small subunit ribosomal protein S4
MRRFKKKYSRPRKLFDAERIKEEKLLLKKYGLKNKREIWKANSLVENFRRKAKNLIKEDISKQEAFVKSLQKLGFNVKNIDDILSLEKEAVLERRLQTIVFRKKLANTPRHARQLIVHKKIMVNNKIVNIPSYIVPFDEEDKISLVKKEKIKNEQ